MQNIIAGTLAFKIVEIRREANVRILMLSYFNLYGGIGRRVRLKTASVRVSVRFRLQV